MENSKRSFTIAPCLWLFVGILVLFIGSAKAENFTEPRKNGNHSPFQQWRSAAICMMNISKVCTDKDKLTFNGTLDVPKEEVPQYCNGGCKQHTLDVLQCIHEVKRDFWFANKAPVWVLQDLINQGCSNLQAIELTGKWKSSGTMLTQKTGVSVISSLFTLFFIAFSFNM